MPRLVFANEGLLQSNTIGELSRDLIEQALSIFFWKTEHAFQCAHERVFATSAKKKILRGVVQLIAIAMMDYLFGRKWPANHACHDDSVLTNACPARSPSTKDQITGSGATLAVGSTLSPERVAVLLETTVVETAHAKSIGRSFTFFDLAASTNIKAAVSALAVVASSAKKMLNKVGVSVAVLGAAKHSSDTIRYRGETPCA